ncbi:MAG: family 10 glycosylhydrolase [Prevotella sp.]|nr:family 10 glycosylhydrolase [Prevotella sp.]
MEKTKLLWLFVIVAVFTSCASSNSVESLSSNSKREFRGAWIQCVNGQFVGMTTEQMQKTLTFQLDELKKDGVNAIIFQVRPECDALYKSDIEPWSRFLTSRQGAAPAPYWDPLQWMITQCHSRGMELHAWINPYRARTKTTKDLAPNHIAVRHPDWVFSYDGLLILNPGIPEARDYVCAVVDDIVSRYDIDGLHIDDYFYPYPAAGQKINDEKTFAEHRNGFSNINDWRRDNVSVFVQQLSKTIHKRKPWVKFGVSPFGIYRNKTSAPNGSDTHGTQNFDDLYADVLLWVNNGWIDYCVPQLYWEIGNKAADYKTLITWWNSHAANRPLYIGEDIERTAKYPDLDNANINQMRAKYKLHAQMPNVQGTVLWYAKAAVDNIGNYGTNLRQVYWKFPALQPTMPFIDDEAPKKPQKVKVLKMDNDHVLFWTAPKGKGWTDEACKYVIYRFNEKEKVNLADPSKIVTITQQTFLKLPYKDGKTRFVYVITALDRMNNESAGVVKKVKL